MNADVVIPILFVLLTVAVFGWGLYQQVKGNSVAAASEFIAMAQKTGLLGHEKMALVVNWLYERIPIPLRSIFTRAVLEKLAQGVYDSMKLFSEIKGKPEAADQPPDML